VTTALPHRPIDATLSVTKAARLLGVHPNTIRAWSDQGRLRFYRINARGDRRYRLGDLQRFLSAAESAGLRVGPDVGPGTALARRGPGRRRADPWSTGVGERAIAPPVEVDEHHAEELAILADLGSVAASAHDLETTLSGCARLLREALDVAVVAILEARGGELVPVVSSGRAAGRVGPIPAASGAASRALGGPAPVVSGLAEDRVPLVAGAVTEVAVAIPGEGSPWGLLILSSETPDATIAGDDELMLAIARMIGVAVRASRRAEEVEHHLHRADALRRVAGDIGSRLDLDEILAGLVDHAMVLFGGDRAAVFLRHPNGQTLPAVTRGLSASYLASVRDFPRASLPAAAVAARRPLFATGYRDDPRGAGVRAAVVQEGYDTICAAPLFDGAELLGLLNVYHDKPRPWSADELETMAALAVQASVAIKTAQNYSQMARWAAQLQSIQQLGARLNRLRSVREIGLAIATELRQLIDYHNVRVYRLEGEDLIPVAMQGQVGEYVDETVEQLAAKLGHGITGWVAQHGIAQNLPDAANDPRAQTIPGTEDDLDESMLLAPMIFEDQVLGVLVLSKLGLHQFSDDELRLLVIYASFAAQAMANAEATELLRSKSDALERQLRSQRELLAITESILTTLDPRTVLELIAERLGDLVRCDNIAIEVLDRAAGLLMPLTARGIHATEYLEPWAPGETGLATWVVEHNEPQLVVDQLVDPRVNQFASTKGLQGSLICVPLRGREGATGVLTLERLGEHDAFSEEEFELVKLFAAQVSIALQNAETHRAVEIRARTDDLTGLLNHGTFEEWLRVSVAAGDPFSLVMIDLDDFKAVNDALGHQAGDRLLREIGQAIVAAGRETDHVFRYGGDEFALILAGTGGPETLGVAERVRSAIHAVGQSGTEWHGLRIEVSASVGLASFPSDGSTPTQILLAADRACFVAKRTGHGLIATAEEGLALAAEFSLQEPTPVDPPTRLD
jgi:diguanylate cyclase (GGDEF)-like protein/excisionase family DNA binding protein